MDMSVGHLLIIRHRAQTLLLDTGSPVSIGRRPITRFLDREIPLLPSYQGMTVEEWSETIGVHIDVLLGSDVLSRFDVTIDPDAGAVVFDTAPQNSRTAAAPLHTVAGMPVVVFGLAGRRLKALLHTGAMLSCLRTADVGAYRLVGVARDHYPGIGEFTTDLRLVPLMFGDQPIMLECGRMPPTVERVLGPVDLHGIIGTNLLRTFSVGWRPGFGELRIVARRRPAAPLGFVRFAAGLQIGRGS
ncbi:MAG: hypothetical protein ACM37V_09080 [Gemmatimonadota bacterium]